MLEKENLEVKIKGLTDREKENIVKLATATQKEVTEYNLKHSQIDRSRSRVDISKASQYINAMYEETKLAYRSMSTVASPQRALPSIDRKNARSVLAAALVEGSKTMLKKQEIKTIPKQARKITEMVTTEEQEG